MLEATFEKILLLYIFEFYTFMKVVLWICYPSIYFIFVVLKGKVCI